VLVEIPWALDGIGRRSNYKPPEGGLYKSWCNHLLNF